MLFVDVLPWCVCPGKLDLRLLCDCCNLCILCMFSDVFREIGLARGKLGPIFTSLGHFGCRSKVPTAGTCVPVCILGMRNILPVPVGVQDMS